MFLSKCVCVCVCAGQVCMFWKLTTFAIFAIQTLQFLLASQTSQNLWKTWTHKWSTATSSSVRLLQGLGGSGGFVSNTGGPMTSPNSWSIKTFASNFSAKIKAVCKQRRNGEETMTSKSISFIFSSSASCLNVHQCSFKIFQFLERPSLRHS